MASQGIPLPFGEWLPDLGENENPGLVEAKNVIPDVGGYRPVDGVDTLTITETGAGRSCFTHRMGAFNGPTFASMTFCEETDRLFIVRNGSIVGTQAITSSSIGPYRTARFDDSVFLFRPYLGAASTVYRTDGTGSSFNIVSGIPGGVGAAQVGRFMVFARSGAVDDLVNGDPFEFRWSAFNNPNDYTVSQTTQSGIATVNDTSLGAVTGISGGRNPMIFQEYGVSQFQYVGPPVVWRTQPIDVEVGCVAPLSIQKVGDLVYFMSHIGPCVANGVSVERLGAGRVNDWIMTAVKDSAISRMQSAHVERDNAIYWAFESANSPYASGVFDVIIGYNYLTNRFFRVEIGDGVAAIGSYGVEQNGSRISRESQRLLFWNDSSPGVLSLLNRPASPGTSNALAAEVTTGYRSLVPGQRIAVNAVEPVYDGAGAKVAINTKANQAGAATAGTPVAVNSLGIANVRADGRLAAVSVTFDAGAEWSELKGAVVTADTSGAR